MTWRPLPEEPASRPPRPVRASLDRLAVSLGVASPAVLGPVFARWEQLVGPEVAAHARPLSLRGGVLTVVTDHPAWATSLRLLAGDVLARVAEAGGSDEVRELTVLVRPWRDTRQGMA